MKRKPDIDFLCIGAQKGGTTWLHARLAELSSTEFPLRKEIHYFDRDPAYPSPNILANDSLFNKIVNLSWVKAVKQDMIYMAKNVAFNRDRLDWFFRYFFSRYTDDWYLSIFRELDGVTGDITPSYAMLNEEDVRRMKTIAPNARIIFLLRNPIHRAWSHLRYTYSDRLVNMSYDQMKAFIDSDRQHLRSDYMRTIETYANVYDDEQIIIGYYDAIKNEPVKLLETIVDHISGNPEEIKQNCRIHEQQNVSKKIQIPLEIEDYLKEKYFPHIHELSDTLGGYASHWLADLESTKVNKTPPNQPALTLAEVK